MRKVIPERRIGILAPDVRRAERDAVEC